MLQTIALVALVTCWFAWIAVFARVRRTVKGHQKVVTAREARVGIVLQMVAYAMACAYFRQPLYGRPAAALIAGMLLGPLAVILAWTATRHLGKQWRIDAALSADHDLIQTGPYCIIRHPIYASMLAMHLALCAIWSLWPLPLISIPLMLIGIEIRIRAEDRLLSQRFGEAFAAYRSTVPAYLPFLR